MNYKTKLAISLISSLVFTVITLIAIRFVIMGSLNIIYVSLPAILSFIFTIYYNKLKKHK